MSGTKGGFPIGEINGNFIAKFIWAWAFLFVYSLAGEILLFKIVKIDLTNSRWKNSPQLLDQSKHKYISIFALSANTFQSESIELNLYNLYNLNKILHMASPEAVF